MTLIPELERELTRAISQLVPRGRGSRWPRVTLLAPLAALVAGGTVALAAAGVIKIGAPETTPGSAVRTSPTSGYGVVRPHSSELLPLRVQVPGSPLPWGLRVSSTSRGLGCVTAGLVYEDQLGSYGSDATFHDDGRFHPFPVQTTEAPWACAPLDAAGRLFVSVSEGDVPTSASRFYRCPGAGGRDRPQPNALCGGQDTRSIYYGLLGPQATSVTYHSDGRTHTITPEGPHGAYLIALPADPHDLNGVSSALVPSNEPITSVTYRGGQVCTVPPVPLRRAPGCRVPPGYRPVTLPSFATTSVATTVTQHRHGTWSIALSFNSPVAVASAKTAYTIELRTPGTPKASAIGDTFSDYHRGERITYTFTGLTRPGLYTGTVMLTRSSAGLFAPALDGVLAARFAARVP